MNFRPIDQRTIVDFLSEEIVNVQVVYLFGSAAAPEDAGDPNDLDIAVLAGEPLDPVERWKLQEALARRLHTHVDLVDLRSASTVLRMQVVAHGRVLYQADPVTREVFEDAVFAAYARLNESRRDILADAVGRGRIHG